MPPDRQPDFTSRTGSRYWFTDAGVFRYSNHWARVANCKWRLEGKAKNGYNTAYANWTDFYPDNSTERLYYIAVDFEKHTAEYHHRDLFQGDQLPFLRTATETAKRIREIRQLLRTDNWAKYCDQPLEHIRRQVVTALIQTPFPAAKIRATRSGKSGI